MWAGFRPMPLVRRGRGTGLKNEERATSAMKKREYKVRLNLHRGTKTASILTTDLSYDYVKINASYRS